MAARYIFALTFLFFTHSTLSAQDWPDKIRGYKVERSPVSVDSLSNSKRTAIEGEVLVSFRELRLSMETLMSVGFEAEVDMIANVPSGRIELITFSDIHVNGIPVAVKDFDTTFDLKKNRAARLPVPVRGSIRMSGIAVAAYRELVESKETWDITGTVFVFGKFRKFGFGFKRAIPIPVKLTIDNPLTTTR